MYIDIYVCMMCSGVGLLQLKCEGTISGYLCPSLMHTGVAGATHVRVLLQHTGHCCMSICRSSTGHGYLSMKTSVGG